MKFRKLRIAWSVFWGLACVLLICLWVRSYWWGDEIQTGRTVVLASVNSTQGRISFAKHVPYWSWGKDIYVVSWPMENPTPDRNFHWYVGSGNIMFGAPHWFATTIVAAFAALPSFRRRFTLRTLLIAMTLVAVLLGLVVYTMK